jgi:uncharacterized protein (TIGR03435 family)
MMLEKGIGTAALVFFLFAAHAQVVPKFEVASVRISTLSARGEGSNSETLQFTPTTLLMRNVTLCSCIRWAYDVSDFQLIAPGWLRSDLYDITAKTSDSVPVERLRMMLRSLLAERFSISLHHEIKEFSVYALRMTNRRPGLRASNSDAPSTMRPNGGALEFHNMSMVELAERLSGRPFGIDRPVIDRTEKAGSFDFLMKLASNDVELKSSLERRELDHDNSLFIKPLRELGLRLQSEKGPVDVLVVGNARRKPIEN